MNPATLAAEIKNARDRRLRLEPLTSRVAGFDVDAAYQIAALVHEARIRDGERPLGRKVGFSNRDLWQPMNVDGPVWGYVYDRTVRYEPQAHATHAIGALIEPRIEPEIVVRFRTAPPQAASPEALLASIDWIAHGFELVECPYPGWKFSGPDTVAAFAFHAALLIGPTRSVAELGPDAAQRLSRFTLELTCNGQLRDRGGGEKVLGSPLASLAHLIEVLARRPGAPQLTAGEIVTTGTLTGAPLISPGERWATTIEGIDLPGFELELVA